MRESGKPKLYVPSETRYLSVVGAFVVELCHMVEPLAEQEQLVYDIQLAVNEAVANAIQHAYAGRSDGMVEICFCAGDNRLIVDVVDWGQAFDFAEIPESSPSELQEGGRGLWLMRQLMDEVTYRAHPRKGNRMHMVKELVQ